MRRLFASLALFSGLLFAASPALATITACDQAVSGAQETQVRGMISSGLIANEGELHCLNVSSLSASERARSCASSITCAESGAMCCTTGARPGSTGGSTGGTSSGSSFFRLELPACVTNGDCTVDDIVRTGVNFANFLFGISGAILLATFVYGGVLYITAGSSGNVGKAKDMIKNALIGMVLVFGAGALVTTVYDTFRSDTSGVADRCTTEHPTFSCQYLTATDEAGRQSEVRSRGCITGLCAGDTTRVCCPEASR